LVRWEFYAPEYNAVPAPLGCGLVFLFQEFGPAAFCGRPHLFLDKSPI
jgi:hypothetical protein